MAKIPKPQKSQVDTDPLSRPGAIRLKASRGLVLLLVVLPALLVFGAGAIGYWIRGRINPTLETEAKSLAANTSSGTQMIRTGPWGTLESQRTVLQIPTECLHALANSSPTPARWVFKGYTKEQVLGLFFSASLSESQQTELGNTSLWQLQKDRIVVQPPRSVILSLSPAARGIIYTALARFPENPLQHTPFYWKTKEEAEFFSHPAFSESAKLLIQRLSYAQGNLSLFADMDLLLQVLPASAVELADIQKQLSRKPAVLLKLLINPESDVDVLMRYWGVGGLTKLMQPALDAVARMPQGRKVALLAVLPPFARERLNTYPCATDNDGMDGCWTAFNFFNDPPGPTVADAADWGRKLKADYFTVFTDPHYGDIVVVARPNGEVVQAAVYLADDLVFTRTGPTRWEPWLIMSVPDLLEVSGIRLPHQEVPVISYYRNRSF